MTRTPATTVLDARAWPSGPARASALLMQVTEAHRNAVIRIVEARFRNSQLVSQEWVEDAVQAAAQRLWMHKEDIHDLRSFWVTSAANVVRDMLKSGYVRRRVAADIDTAERRVTADRRAASPGEREVVGALARVAEDRHAADTPLGRLIRTEFRQDVESFLLDLDSKSRLIFVMHDIEGHDHLAISRATGMTIGAVKMRLSRARRALREWLDLVRPDIITTELGA